MELYRKYPVFITIWALAENILFAGVIFGWGSLVRILKDEGFYLDLCKQSYIINETNSLLRNTSSGGSAPSNISETNIGSFRVKSSGEDTEGCPEQESKLNLWFSIGTSVMNLSFIVAAYMQRLFGTRITRVVFVLVVYLAGTLCMAFATPELPWLLLPGLSGIGIGGLSLSCTNVQLDNGFILVSSVPMILSVSYLHPRLQSTIVALFVGTLDFSAINKQLIRIAYENGISRRTSYIFMTIVLAVSVSISTLFFLPKMSIGDDYLKEMEKKRKQTKFANTEDTQGEKTENQDKSPKLQDHELIEIISIVDASVSAKAPKPSYCTTVFSVTYILHNYWLFVHAIRMFTFFGQINVWLEYVFDNDEDKVGDMLSVFYYMVVAAIGTALFCGFIYDFQRKRYSCSDSETERAYIPAVLPICLVILFSTGTTILCLIKNDVTPYFAFILITFFKTSLFGVAYAFLENVFPADYFGTLMGILLFVTGIAGLIQYPLFQWYEAYEGSHMHVNIFMLILQVSTVLHPVLVYVKGRQGKDIINK